MKKLLVGILVVLLWSCEAITSLFTPPDETGPGVTILSPEEGDVVSGIVTVTVQAEDPGGIFRVVLYLDGVSKEEDRASPYEFSVDVGALSGGLHVLTATAWDQAGNSGSSLGVSVEVRNFGGTYRESFDGYPLGATGTVSGNMPSDASWAGMTVGSSALDMTDTPLVGKASPGLRFTHGGAEGDLAAFFAPIPRLRQGFLEMEFHMVQSGCFCLSLGSGTMENSRTGFFLWFADLKDGKGTRTVWFSDGETLKTGTAAFSLGQTHHLRILFDTEKGTWDLLMDGQLIISQAPVVQTLEAVEYISLTTMGLSEALWGGIFLVDDLATGPVEGAENPGSGNLEPPVFTQSSGAYRVYTPILITCAQEGCEIRYTTDGKDPDVSAKVYTPSSPPLLSQDSLWKAAVFKDGDTSPVVQASYTITPFYPDFSLEMKAGKRWNFHYEWHHWVGYSYYGDKSFTSVSDFSFVLLEPVNIQGKELFLVAATGAQADRVRWKYLGCDAYRIYGSTDGVSLEILFDAQYGIWVGQSFFGSFGEGAPLSLTQEGDEYVLYKGWRFDDNDSVYYPETGTIYDSDYYSGYSQVSEKYRDGDGPCYWRTSKGSSSYYEASSDTYTITLTSIEEGVDVGIYKKDGEVSKENFLQEFTLTGDSGSLWFVPSNSFADYVIFTDFPDGGDPVLNVYSWNKNMQALVSGQNLQTGNQEFFYGKDLGGKVTIQVRGLGDLGGRIRICVMKVSYGETRGYYMSSILNSNIQALGLSSSRSGTLPVDYPAMFAETPPDLFGSTVGYGRASYSFIIPVDGALDLKLCLVKEKTILYLQKTGTISPPAFVAFTGSDFIKYLDDGGAGAAECLKYTGTQKYMAQVWEDTDGDGATELGGGLIFGWGVVP